MGEGPQTTAVAEQRHVATLDSEMHLSCLGLPLAKRSGKSQATEGGLAGSLVCLRFLACEMELMRTTHL